MKIKAKTKKVSKVKRKPSKRARNPISSDKLRIYVDPVYGAGELYLSDIRFWMENYMKKNPKYDPLMMAHKAGEYFKIGFSSKKAMEQLAFDLAEKFEYEKQRSIQRKASVKTRGFPLGLGNSPFKKQNPTLREITLPEIKKWMVRYIELNPNYDKPDDIAKHAIIHLNIQVTPQDRKDLTRFAYNVADDYEMNRKR